jgi:rubrerythrin
MQRTCRYEHGQLELLMGWYALQGVQDYPAPGAGLLSQTKVFKPTGRFLALRVWRCPECGYTELVDEKVG